MGNHYHLLIETPGANLSSFMHRLQAGYTIRHNRRHGKSGHLFQGRYKAIVVDKDGYLLELSRYIHLNPVRAGLVEKPGDWEWSSYRDYVKDRGKEKLVVRKEILGYFKNHPGGLERAYRKWVETEPDNEEADPLGKVTGQVALGGEEFIEGIREKIKSRRAESGNEIPTLRNIHRWDAATAENAISNVAKHFGVTSEQLKTPGSRNNTNRDIAIYIVNKYSGWRLSEIADIFGISYSAVSKASNRVEERLLRDKTFSIKAERDQILIL